MKFVVATILIAVIVQIDCQTYDDANRLLDHLFKDAKYNKNIRPSTNQSEATQVNITHHISTIDEMNVANGYIITLNEISVQWFDMNLAWNMSEFEEITQISIPHDIYWKPGLTLKSGSSNYDMDISNMISSPAFVTHTGVVKIVHEGYFKSKCISDTTFFPFGSTECHFVISCSNHGLTEVQLFSSLPTIDGSFYTNSNALTVEKIQKYRLGEHSASSRSSVIANSIFVKRRPPFQIIHNYLSRFILVILCEVTCFVPVQSGERLTFAMTVFLSYVFMSSALGEELPRDSIQMSISTNTVLFGCITTTLGVFWSIFIVCLSSLDTENWKIPKLLIKITMRITRKILTKHRNGNYSSDISDVSDSGNEHEDNSSKKTEPALKLEENHDCISWLDVGKVLDILYFACLLTSMSVLIIVHGIVLAYNNII